ncbi:relaxase/mobilization nuclease RlxS [Sphingomonas sp.]|jgi:type IV secretory pathway VirD2 relaxase|uniref:relaxase/mobilization nuclease RlxS n=1 Tax=Sphingomonas sp. TaxID=28214 RepID=UPI003566E5E4
MPDDPFELWLGRLGNDRPFAHRMRGAVNRAGGTVTRKASSFTGVRIGRGSGVGRILASRGGWTGRRVVVKARIVKLGGKGQAAAVAHLRYLQRDGTTREGERGQLYGRAAEAVDGKAFLERGSGDRHQFRFIVAPEDGAEYEDLKPLVRRWMTQVEQDLGTKLDWVAVDHFNTGHPHSHVIVRGKDDRGKDLIIAREYVTQGLRARAAELVDLDLGPRSPQEILRANSQEVEQERFTGIDRRLLQAIGEDGLVRPAHQEGVEQSLRAGRLQTLGRMGLAREEGRGNWRLDADLERTLRLMGERGDIIRTMQRAMTQRAPERSPADYTIYDPDEGGAAPIIGRVVARGLADEFADRHYLIVDGTDGLSHYVDIGIDAPATSARELVRIAPAGVTVRAVDRTVAEIAVAHGGSYSVDLHLQHDPSATEAFAETHIRRLEAFRRGTGDVERRPDGSWAVAPDHLARVEAWERGKLRDQPVTIETLSTAPVEQLARHDGVTWLDRELTTPNPTPTGRGFGAEVRKALDLRRQWLVEQQLADGEGENIRVRANLLATLRLRELRRVAGQLSEELGMPFAEAKHGQLVEGIYRRQVQIGDGKYAFIEKSRDFTLVPWRPVLEKAIGKQVSGIMRETGGISWTIGRGRGLGIS